MKVLLIDKQNIAKEVFDNEAVMINIPAGKYYSVRGEAGLRVLEILEEPTTQEAIMAILLNEFKTTESDAQMNLTTFLEQLSAEEILVETSEVAVSEKLQESVAQKLPFGKLALEVYDDMQELLLVDPVHDVESLKGWPQKKNG